MNGRSVVSVVITKTVEEVWHLFSDVLTGVDIQPKDKSYMKILPVLVSMDFYNVIFTVRLFFLKLHLIKTLIS